MELESYLERIGFNDSKMAPNLENLRAIQLAHLLHVPFENLDIHWGNEITLDVGRFYRKIVKKRRGGFCYELNGLFNELLNNLGYKTKIISARVANADGDYGDEYDHLAIVSVVNEEQYLVDAGFGDFSAEPLKIWPGIEQKDSNGIFRINETGGFLEVAKKAEDGWKKQYKFKNMERDLSEFAGMCVYNQTSPNSHFTHGKLCSLMLEAGRKTLTDNKFIVTANGEKREFEVNSEQKFAMILLDEFGITANGGF